MARTTTSRQSDEHNRDQSGSQSRSSSSGSSRGTTSSSSSRGGTHEQHVEAGHLGGIAPHRCRGRECSEQSSNSNRRDNE